MTGRCALATAAALNVNLPHFHSGCRQQRCLLRTLSVSVCATQGASVAAVHNRIKPVAFMM